jgi:septal ring factor EnvC (AmiA/AmiB activator)
MKKNFIMRTILSVLFVLGVFSGIFVLASSARGALRDEEERALISPNSLQDEIEEQEDTILALKVTKEELANSLWEAKKNLDSVQRKLEEAESRVKQYTEEDIYLKELVGIIEGETGVDGVSVLLRVLKEKALRGEPVTLNLSSLAQEEASSFDLSDLLRLIKKGNRRHHSYV